MTTTHVTLGAGKHVHALRGGRTLCGLSTLFVANVQQTSKKIDCVECRRVQTTEEAATRG